MQPKTSTGNAAKRDRTELITTILSSAQKRRGKILYSTMAREVSLRPSAADICFQRMSLLP